MILKKLYQTQKKPFLLVIFSLALLIPLCVVMSFFSGSSKSDDQHSFCVYFTEVLASNSMYPDSRGQFPDYVEIYNSSDGSVDVSGFRLTDDQRSVKYRIPEGTVLGSQEYLVIWCETYDGETESDDPWLADFSIDKSGGETVYLMNRKNVIVDTVTTVPSERNLSMILTEDGSWTLSSFATPGFSNTQEGYQDYLLSRSASSFPVQLNELLSSNTLYPSESGDYSDFIELYNPTENEVDLSGCRLTDDPEKIKYVFPSGTVIPAEGYLLLWCGDEGVSFRLSSQGTDTVQLQSPSGEIMDQVLLPALAENVSYCRCESGEWITSELVTPGYPNTEEGFLAWSEEVGFTDYTILISEAMAVNQSTLCLDNSFPDWIELVNTGTSAVDLTGCWLSDKEEDPFRWCFPETTLEPGDYLLLLCDDQEGWVDGYYHTGFSLSSSGEVLLLSSPAGTLIDSLPMPFTESDQSLIRTGSDSTDVTLTYMTTPGLPNTEEAWLTRQESLLPPQDLMISEVMTANFEYLQQDDNEYYDWIELYNNSGDDLDLTGYQLCDDPDSPNRIELSGTLEKDGYLTVTLKDAPFGLNASEDHLYLLNPEGVIVDYLRLANIPYRQSMGRIPEEGGFFYFETPTPRQPNGEGSRLISSLPTASVQPGIYNDTEFLSVELTADSENSSIYYTTDGDWPDTNSTLYTGPIEITETTVIRAISVSEGCLPSQTASLGYFLNENLTMPIVSVTCDEDDLFSDYDGIYVNIWEDWEKYANISYYDLDGTGFSADCGLSLFGSLSRETNAKKSFKVNFRPRYGQSSVVYDLYEDYDVNEFYSLVLRSGQDYPLSMMREELMTSLAKDASDSVLTQATKYCILFLNGEYFGIYNLKEAFSEEYFASHFDVPVDSVQYSRVINVYTNTPDLYDLMQFTSNNDMTVDENYQYICEHVDMESLVDWMIFESYCANTDILNNVRYFMSTELDGKWKFAFYDVDWAFFYNSAHWIFEEDQLSTMMPRNLIKNEDFQDYFLKRVAYHLENTLSDDNVLARIAELEEQLRPEIERERDCWSGSVTGWENNVEVIRNYVSRGRARRMADLLSDYLNLTSEQREYYFGGIQ